MPMEAGASRYLSLAAWNSYNPVLRASLYEVLHAEVAVAEDGTIAAEVAVALEGAVAPEVVAEEGTVAVAAVGASRAA